MKLKSTIYFDVISRDDNTYVNPYIVLDGEKIPLTPKGKSDKHSAFLYYTMKDAVLSMVICDEH